MSKTRKSTFGPGGRVELNWQRATGDKTIETLIDPLVAESQSFDALAHLSRDIVRPAIHVPHPLNMTYAES